MVTWVSTYMDRSTGRLFIIVLNKALCYSKKLGHSLINPNQLRSYGTMVWDKPFDSKRLLCVETGDGDTIYILANGIKVGFDSRAPTDHKLKSLPHVHLTSKI